ncbi:hypothetical protein APX70_06619 [Pseudomonas syringae pv. maculicola]|uniref:Uncharacterized protein n=1 Tax=Pseudomonas syringae pv. maculicola TaxID=59511 RepID=A0A3M2YX27_PSEYM|nr:hypothetical protein APX70_06619 [Pseudomonas syringae pv. maculicola]
MSRLVREGQHQDLAGRDTALDQVFDAMDQCRRFTSTRPGNNVDEGFGRGSSIVLPLRHKRQRRRWSRRQYGEQNAVE